MIGSHSTSDGGSQAADLFTSSGCSQDCQTGSVMFQGAVAVDSRAHSDLANEQRIQGLLSERVEEPAGVHEGERVPLA